MTESLWLVIDILLALSLLSLAGMACLSRQPQSAVTTFMAMGLVLALIWARLAAPDLAIAEAAIGSGLMGALMLLALDQSDTCCQSDPKSSLRFISLSVVLGLLAIALSVWIFQALPLLSTDPLAQRITELLPTSGVTNPVTAVLLNYRLYDTMLEIAVLLAAVIGITSLASAPSLKTNASATYGHILMPLVCVLFIAAGFILWIGAKAPGGAFQAGVMFASAYAVLHFSGFKPGLSFSPPFYSMGMSAGLIVILLHTAVSRWLLLPPMSYPDGHASLLILLIEIAATISIATLLSLALRGGWPPTLPTQTSAANNLGSAS